MSLKLSIFTWILAVFLKFSYCCIYVYMSMGTYAIACTRRSTFRPSFSCIMCSRDLTRLSGLGGIDFHFLSHLPGLIPAPSFFKNYFIFCWCFSQNVCLWIIRMQCSLRTEEGTISTGTRITVCKQPCRWQGLNSGLLENQLVLLIASHHSSP